MTWLLCMVALVAALILFVASSPDRTPTRTHGISHGEARTPFGLPPATVMWTQ